VARNINLHIQNDRVMRNPTILLSLVIFSLLLTGCETEKQQVTVTLTDHTGCKGLKSATDNDIPNTQSCINWSFDVSSGTLSLAHVNAGFNCCPGTLSCSIKITGDTLVITESEEAPMCDCDCLFDLFIDISGLEKQSYIIRIIEPYCGDQQKLIFEADLATEPEGSFCASRNQYPWGMPL
jgi:hypothetical protein